MDVRPETKADVLTRLRGGRGIGIDGVYVDERRGEWLLRMGDIGWRKCVWGVAGSRRERPS